jgi:hypothetical protein
VNVEERRGIGAYVAGLLVDADMAVLLEALALGEVGDDVPRHQDGDPDVGPQLSPQGLVEPNHSSFACLKNYTIENLTRHATADV